MPDPTPTPASENTKPFLKMARLLIPLLVLFIAYSCCFILPADATGFVMRLGKVSHEVTEPGLYFKMPWPVDHLVSFEKHKQIYESPISELRTSDGNVLLARGFMIWQVANPVQFYERCQSIPAMQLKLYALMQDQMRIVFAKYTFAQVFSPAVFQQLQAQLSAQLKKEAESLYAITLSASGIDRLELPSRVVQSVLDRQNAEYQQMAVQMRSVAEKEAAEISQKAAVERAQLLADAEKTAGQIRADAEKETLKNQAVFNENRELADFLQRLNAIELILKDRTTLVITPGTPPFDILSDSYKIGN